MQAAQHFRYEGKVVDAAALIRRPTPVPSLQTVSAAAALAAPTVPPADLPYGRTTGGVAPLVPDVGVARAGYERIALPTAAPDDERGGRIPLVRAPRAGLDIVFGAAASAPPVSSAEPDVAIARTLTPDAQTAPTPARATDGRSGEVMPGRRHAPAARYLVAAGTKIYAQLDGSIQSDIPGPCTAHIVTPVVDALSGEVLIPAGTRALCYYGGLAKDASRLSLSWTRLVFPDRSSFVLDQAPALDEEGHVGLGGSLDDHRARLFRATFIGAILGGLAQRLAGTSSTTNVYVVAPTGGTPNYSASAQMVLDLVSRLNGRDAQLPPTLIVPANAQIEIYVDRDMLFEAPYSPMGPTS